MEYCHSPAPSPVEAVTAMPLVLSVGDWVDVDSIALTVSPAGLSTSDATEVSVSFSVAGF